MKTNKFLAISMVAMAALSFTACNPDNNTPDDAAKTALEKSFEEITRIQYVDKVVVPTYRGLADASRALNETIEKFDTDRTDANLGEVCILWKSARQYWEWSEAFLFGPATTYGIDPHIDTWPFNEVTFNALMNKLDPVNNEDDAEILIESIKYTQNLTGFHALEYIIFRDGKQRAAADLTDKEVYFIKAVGADLQLASIKLVSAWGGEISEAEQAILDEEEWEPERNFGEAFKAYSGKVAVTTIIEGARDIIGEVNEMKIGSAHGGADTKYIESPHAYNSIQDFYDNILSCQHAIYGGLGATTPEEGSLIALTQDNDALKDQTAVVVAALENALDKINSMKKPFVLNYEDQSAGDAMVALGTLDDELKKLEDQINNYSEK